MKKYAYIIFLCFSFDAFPRCANSSLEQLADRSKVIVSGKISSSNYAPRFFDNFLFQPSFKESFHKFQIEVDEVFKGNITEKALEISFPYHKGQKESQKLFKIGEHVVLMLGDVKGDKAILPAQTCNSWGGDYSLFEEGSENRKKLMKAIKH